MLSPKQQAAELINKSHNILIVLPKDLCADALGSGLALFGLAQDLGKKADLIAHEPVPEKLFFLPGLENVKSELSSLRDFIISIDTSQKRIKQLRYENKDAVLKIYLAGPDKLEQKDVKLEPGPFVYDALITIDTPDLETLGQFYENYAELFFEKPILNIDHKSGNEYFGEINMVEPTASSSAEIVTDFINSFFPNQLSESIATCLLTGLIDETHSFQKINTIPQTFNLASLLVSRGAEKEKIVQALYKTKPLNLLRLWGRILARLEYDTEKNLASTEVTAEDLAETNSSINDLPAVSDEINELLPQLCASTIFWLSQPGEIMVLVHSERPELLNRLALELGGSAKNGQALFKILAPDVTSAKSQLLALISSLL